MAGVVLSRMSQNWHALAWPAVLMVSPLGAIVPRLRKQTEINGTGYMISTEFENLALVTRIDH